jgi:Ser/Thr protein kinase RdoA (MazF antagonist)
MSTFFEKEAVAIQEMGSKLYGITPLVKRLISYTNRVYLLSFQGEIPDKVIKVAGMHPNADIYVRQEQVAMRALHSHGLEVPPIEFTQQDYPGFPRSFIIMPKLAGDTLERKCRPHDPPWAQHAWEWAGSFLARLSKVPLSTIPNVWTVDVTRQTWFDVYNAFEREGLLQVPIASILREVKHLMERSDTCLIHGDFAASQIITDGTSFGVIDWEGACEGFILAALGRFIALTREYGREYPQTEQHIEWLLIGFQREYPLDDAQKHELHVWEMYSHITDASWKFSAGSEHEQRAYEIVSHVCQWTYLK